MNKLKVLAGQTALYGVSSILGRVINYLLVPIHTAIFLPDQFGSITYFYAYTALFNIIYTLGLETAFFRFSAKENNIRYYHYACTMIILLGILYSGSLIIFSDQIAEILDHPDQGYIIRLLAAILWIDAIMAIPFAKLRLENKATKFVLAKVSSLVLTVLLNLFFLVLLQGVYQGNITSLNFLEKFYNPELGIGYVFIANLIGSFSLIFFLWKEVSQIRLRFSWLHFKPVLVYALPIMIAGLAGIMNENIDKIFIPQLLSEGYYGSQTPLESLGIYSAAFKMGVFMMLAVQAFRFAGEPFFFSNAENKEAPELFAKVMHYFVVGCSIILVAVSLNIDIIAFIFLRDQEYWQALYLVPIFLLAKIFYGIFINLSAWYKIKDKTNFGIYFTLLGLGVIILGNLIFLPIIGLFASAYSALLGYIVMCIAAYLVGKKHFPIPYKLLPIGIYLIISFTLSTAGFYIEIQNFWADTSFKLLITILFIFVVFLIEKKNLLNKFS